MKPSSNRNYLFAVAILTLVAAQCCTQWFWRKPVPWHSITIGLYVMGLILVLYSGSVINTLNPAQISRKWKVIAVVFLILFVTLMRFSYLRTVNMGYNGEILSFLFEAGRIYDTLRLQPQRGHLFMMYSYIIAGMMVFLGKSLFTFRVAQALISCTAILCMYKWLKNAFTFRVAYTGSVFLACSLLHLFQSRDGYHHSPEITWQILAFMFVFKILKTRNTYYAIGLGCAVGLGLNTGWGFYYTPVVLFVFLVFKHSPR